jgi:hypothetical protein
MVFAHCPRLSQKLTDTQGHPFRGRQILIVSLIIFLGGLIAPWAISMIPDRWPTTFKIRFALRNTSYWGSSARGCRTEGTEDPVLLPDDQIQEVPHQQTVLDGGGQNDMIGAAGS